MEMPTSFTALLAQLSGGQNKRTKLAEALKKTYWQVTYWSRNNDIPEEYWDDIIALAASKEMPGVTREYLKDLKKRKGSLAT